MKKEWWGGRGAGVRGEMEKGNLLRASPPSSPQSTSTSISLPSVPRPRLGPDGVCCGCAVQARSGAAGDGPLPYRSPLPGKRTRDGGSGPEGVGKSVRRPADSPGLSLASKRSTANGGPNFPGSQTAAAP